MRFIYQSHYDYDIRDIKEKLFVLYVDFFFSVNSFYPTCNNELFGTFFFFIFPMDIIRSIILHKIISCVVIFYFSVISSNQPEKYKFLFHFFVFYITFCLFSTILNCRFSLLVSPEVERIGWVQLDAWPHRLNDHNVSCDLLQPQPNSFNIRYNRIRFRTDYH